MWSSLLATQEMLVVYLGLRLGLYETLADGEPVNAARLAERAGIAPRYAREWLEQQAVAGVLTVEDASKPAEERMFSLPSGHASVLTAAATDAAFSALAVLPLGAVAGALPHLLAAYRTGDGVADEAFGDDWRHGHAAANRAMFRHDLPAWIETLLPDVHATLGEPGRRVADVACGAGWAAISLAQAYPHLWVDGLDVDEPTVRLADRNARDAGVDGRVRFAVRDAADGDGDGGYDLVCLFDALHEMPRPVEVLRACRALRADDGAVLILEAAVAPQFIAPGDEIERFQYCTSLLHCLPAALSGPGAAGTGTVLRTDTVRTLAAEAGFGAVTVLPMDDRFHRLYRLVG
jgi:SAM-dependent methyltransferase